MLCPSETLTQKHKKKTRQQLSEPTLRWKWNSLSWKTVNFRWKRCHSHSINYAAALFWVLLVFTGLCPISSLYSGHLTHTCIFKMIKKKKKKNRSIDLCRIFLSCLHIIIGVAGGWSWLCWLQCILMLFHPL